MATHVQLRAFHAVAIERNFHRAAERLRLTQPAISIQIKNLETESSVVLFRRDGHSVSLTEAGHSLFEITNRMFAAEGEVRELLNSDIEAGFTRTIHLGADGPHAALDLIAKVVTKHPDIRFRVTMANAGQTWENLISLDVDAAVMVTTQEHKNVVTQKISTQDLVALVPSKFELIKDNNQITLEQLAPYPLIFREAGSNTQKMLDEAFMERNIRINPALVMGSREAVKEAVSRGLGIGFVFTKEQGHDPGYSAVPVKGFKGSNTDNLVTLKDQRKNPLVRLLFDAIKDA